MTAARIFTEASNLAQAATGTPLAFRLGIGLVIALVLALVVVLVLRLEMRRATQTLSQAQARLRAIFAGAVDAIFLIEPDGRILEANDAAGELLGLDPSRLADTDITQLLPPEDRHRFVALTADLRHDDVRLTSRTFALGDRSAVVDIRISPAVLGGRRTLVLVARDMTAQRRAEEMLRSSEERYRLLVEGSDQVFFYVHDLEHRFTYVSPSVREVLGYAPEELLGQPYDVTLPGDEEDEQVHRRTDEAVASGRPGAPYRAPAVTRDGRTLVCEVVESPVVRDGVVTGMQGFMRDITAQVDGELERERLEVDLLQKQKMEAVGLLAGGIAHDFNNIMTAIQGNVLLTLEDATGLPQEVRMSLEEVGEVADRAASITQQLLAFSRRQVLQPRVVALNQVIEKTRRLLSRLIGEHVMLVTDLEEANPYVRIDPGQLEQVLVNLAVNARDAMPGGGRLRLATRTVNLDVAEAAGRELEPGDYAQLRVQDTGHGFPAELGRRVFEPFFTTKGDARGTGLGLSTTHGIIAQSGGHIDVSSRPGAGTTFEILLPLVPAPEVETRAPDAAEDAPPAPAPGPHHETVLLVEDEAPVRDLVARILRKQGYRVVAVGDGREALAAWEDGTGFDLIVTDVVMPRMSGVELRQRIRTLSPATPVLFMSGYAAESLPAQHDADELEPLLHKPFSPSDLAATVARVLGRA